MKKIFKLKDGYGLNTFYFILSVTMFGFMLFTSGQILDWENPILYIGLIIVALIFILMSNRGVVEINNGVLSRKRFFITWWSVNISSITDIFRGNMLQVRGGGWLEGLTFRDVNNFFYQIPYDIENEYNLTNAIKIIQPSVRLSLGLRSKFFENGIRSPFRSKNARILDYISMLLVLVGLVWLALNK